MAESRERRLQARVEVVLPCNVTTSDGRVLDGWVNDLSYGGCLLRMQADRTKSGETLTLEIGLLGAKATVAILAEVVRVPPHSAWEGKSEYGLRFSLVEPSQHDDVRRLIDSILEQKGKGARAPRVYHRMEVYCRTSAEFATVARNISSGGISLDSKVALAVDEAVHLELKLAILPNFIEIPGIVRHVRSLPDGFKVGIRFDPLSSSARDALADALRTALEGPGAPIRLRADYRTAEDTIRAVTRALSSRELLLETARPLPPGTRFVFELASPDLPEPLEIDGQVTSVVEVLSDIDGSPRHAMVIKYVFESEKDRARIEGAIDRILKTAEQDHRREWPRAPSALTVRDGSDPLRGNYTIRDLSTGGMQLEQNSPDGRSRTILPGSRIQLEITVAARKFLVAGTVVWATDSGKNDRIGVQFDPGIRSILTDLMMARVIPDSISITFQSWR